MTVNSQASTEELIKSQKQNERLTALVGKVTVEKKWLAKKLKSLGLSNCKQLVELKLSSLHMPNLLGFYTFSGERYLTLVKPSVYFSVLESIWHLYHLSYYRGGSSS
jgi:hypothetical protein